MNELREYQNARCNDKKGVFCLFLLYKVVQIWPGLFTLVYKCKQSRSYLNHLVYVSQYTVKKNAKFTHKILGTLGCISWWMNCVKIHPFFLTNLNQLWCLRHVSNIPVFIIRKNCTCSFKVFCFMLPYKQSGRCQDVYIRMQCCKRWCCFRHQGLFEVKNSEISGPDCTRGRDVKWAQFSLEYPKGICHSEDRASWCILIM